MTAAEPTVLMKDTGAMMSFAIREADRASFSRCDDYVTSFDGASVYHLTEWCELISAVFGHTYHYYLAESSENIIVGVLPVVRLKSRLFGDYMVSMPYFNYGGVLAVNEDIEAALIAAAISKANEEGVQHIEFRDIKRRADCAFVRTDKVAMILPLPEDPDTLWQQLGAKRRSQINRPLREGVVIKSGSEELLNDFYKVFSCNMRDLGTPVYSKHFFAEILRRFSRQSKIIVIYYKDKPVACAFLIGFNGQLEIPWASTLRRVNSIGINMLLYWEVLKFAITVGYKVFDFGRSSIDSGTFRFKKQWGAVPKQLYWHYWLNENQEMPNLNPSNPKYQFAIQAWQRLPLFVANTIGPMIVKNLP